MMTLSTHRSSRSSAILGAPAATVCPERITLAPFKGAYCTVLGDAWAHAWFAGGAQDIPDAAPAAAQFLCDAMAGRTVDAASVGRSVLRADFVVRPFPDDPLIYRVRYDLQMDDDTLGRGYISGECVTYVEQRGSVQHKRRKAFDTFVAGRYDGIRPLDVCQALARNRTDIAGLSAMRIMCELSRRSFLFSREFAPLAARTVHLRPGAFLLRALQTYALGNMPAFPDSGCVPAKCRSEHRS